MDTAEEPYDPDWEELQKTVRDLGEPDITGVIVKSIEESRFVLMVAYSPNRMPYRGADHMIDIASPDVLEKACWQFTDNGLKVGLFHRPGGEGLARCVENYIYRNPEPWVIKNADGSETVIKEGDWINGFIFSPPLWSAYKSGEIVITGASPQGKAGRKPASAQSLARLRSDAP